MQPREVILDAAQKLVAQHGYAGLSMRDLARESGLAKATLYHHFADKQSIYLDMLERDLRRISEHLAEAAATPGSCEERLRAVVAMYFEQMRTRRAEILARMREIAGMEQALRALILRYRPQLSQPIIDILQEGQRQGQFREMEPNMAVLSLFGMMNAFVNHKLLLDDGEITLGAVAHTSELFLRGIRSHGADGA